MPAYDHLCSACNHQWEDTYSIMKDPPKDCPECKGEGTVKRLLPESLGVSVKLSTREFKESIKSEQKKIKKQLATDEKFRANLMGEEKYNNAQTNYDKIDKELKHKS